MSSSNKEKSADQPKKGCILCGVGVTAPRLREGPEPEIARTFESRAAVESLIRKCSCCGQIKNILLLITPAEFPRENKYTYTVHYYRLDSRSHRRVTTVTKKDVRLIEYFHGPDNYSIVYCSGYIEPEDAARNTPIKAEVFDIVDAASKAVRTTWYRGHVVRLAFRCNRSQPFGISPPKQNVFGIQALEQPKIPVRMPCDLAFVASAEEIRKETKLRLRRNLQREFYYSSRHNVRCTRSTDPLRRRHAGGSIPESSDLCEHLGINLQKVKSKWARLAPTKRINKSHLKPSPQSVSTTDEPGRESSETPEFNSEIHQTSSFLIRSMETLKMPPAFSDAALAHLGRGLLSPSAKKVFSKLGKLVRKINERACPQDEHLQRFFSLAELLDFKMYVRQETNFPGFPPLPGPRYRVECYVFDNRQEYLASICLMRYQLRAMARQFPKARRNFRFIDSAFDLTPVPPKVTNYLKSILVAVKARPVYDLLGEITLDCARPAAAVFENENLAEVGE